MTTNIEVDLTDPATQRDPFPVYRWLRTHDPVHWSARLGMWVVTRYDDVQHILQQPILYSSDRFRRIGSEFASRRPDVEQIARVLRDWAVYRDPPDHTRLRGLLAKAFTPRRIELMQSRIRSIVDTLLAGIGDQPRIDYIAQFAFPLPATVIGGLLGVPDDDLPRIKVWSDQIAAYIGGAQRAGDNITEAKRGLLTMFDYFRTLIRARRTDARDDLVSLMLAAEDRGDVLSDDEVVANCVLLLFAGHETTTNLLGNGLFHLLRHPAARDALRTNRALVPAAVEEMLRFDPPVAATIKIASDPVELHGRRIDAGAMVAPFMAAANRDPGHFVDPDTLVVPREQNHHLTFGHGIHFCLGAALARLEAQIAFDRLLDRFDSIALVDDAPSWKPQVFFRGLTTLPIAWHRSR